MYDPCITWCIIVKLCCILHCCILTFVWVMAIPFSDLYVAKCRDGEVLIQCDLKLANVD